MKLLKTIRKNIVVVIGLTILIVCGLPVMSTYLSEGESCTLVIRGYNLMEFSAWSCVPLLSAVLVPLILAGCQSNAAKEAELLLLVGASGVSYVHGLRTAYAWLESITDTWVAFHVGITLYPVCILAVLVLALLANKMPMENGCKMKIRGSKMIVTTPDWEWCIGAGELSECVSRHDKSVKRIARHMRVRPEAVLQIISDAFDESLKAQTLTMKEDCVCFESYIATIMLKPDELSGSWILDFKSKEAMFNHDGMPHPKEVFTVPDTLFDGDVYFSPKALHSLAEMVLEKTCKTDDEILGMLNADYLSARRGKTFLCDADTLEVQFRTSFKAKNGQSIYAVVEPDYCECIPNTWMISKFLCKEENQ